MSKKHRMRECPAAGRPIEAFECAAGRHTTYACPESCPFNVFATASYQKVRDIEHSADEKYVLWVMEHAADRAQFKADMRRSIGDQPSAAYFHRLAWHGVYRVGPGGDTCLGAWAKAGFPGLSADERVLMRSRMRLRPAMLEVHRIMDDHRVEVVDLLGPERVSFVIVDSGFARQVGRFEVYAGHIVPLPHYTRLLGTCVLVPNFHPLAPEEVIQEIIRHLGGPGDNSGRRVWLAEHYEQFDKALEAVALARRRAMFDALDGQGPFTGERRDDLGARLRMNEPKYDPALVPPALLRDTPRLAVTTSRVAVPPGTVPDDSAAAGIIYDRQRGILDEPIPALENKTPRAAASDPALRPQLLRWMKFWISQTDRRNLETGRNDDTNWMVRELGLTEVLFEPPPPRPRLAPPGEVSDEDEDDLPPFLTLPDPPALPNRPWTRPEATEVMDRALKAFSPMSDAADYFSDLQYPLFPDLNDLLGEPLKDEEITCLFQSAAWVVLCFAPRGTRPPEYLTEDLEGNLSRQVAKVVGWSDSGFEAAFAAWLERSRQPELLTMVLALTLGWLEKAPPGLQVREGAKALIIAALGAVVDTLDEAAHSGC